MSAALNVKTSPIAVSTLACMIPIGGTKNERISNAIPKIANMKPKISCMFAFDMFFICCLSVIKN